MITINLIPKEQKEILKNARILKLIKESILLLFIFTATAAIMLLLSRYFLEYQLADLYERNITNIKSNETINVHVSQINFKIASVETIQKNFQSLFSIISKISSITPPNVKINQIKFFRQQATLEISGLSKTRDDLLTFKEKLEQTEWIKSFDLPLSSLIEKENNKFTIKIFLDLKKL